jgi:hypothetical protein
VLAELHIFRALMLATGDNNWELAAGAERASLTMSFIHLSLVVTDQFAGRGNSASAKATKASAKAEGFGRRANDIRLRSLQQPKSVERAYGR